MVSSQPTGAGGTVEPRQPRLIRRVTTDAVTVLTGFLVLLFGIPSTLGIAALGSAGSAAFLYAIGGALWWGWSRLRGQNRRPHLKLSPVRISALLFFGAGLASYVAAATRPLPSTESSPADSGVLRLIAWVGLVVLACDGIPHTVRFRVMVRRFVVIVAVYAGLGLLQFVTKQSFVDAIQLPGFSTAQSFSNIGDRSGFARAAATAQQPLEYAYVLCVAMPLALVLAIEDKHRSTFARWSPAVLIATACALSVSRSAFVGLAVGIVVLAPSLARPIRRALLAAAVVGAAAIYVLVPGMIGTLNGLFTGQDSSTASRTDSYDLAFMFLGRSPFFGRGFGTFLPEYRIFDNQYLLMLIELGAVGVIAFLGMLVTSIVCVSRSRRRMRDPLDRLLGQGLIASVATGGVMLALFDAFSFPQAVGSIFFLIGLCGAYWRLTPRPVLRSVAVRAA